MAKNLLQSATLLSALILSGCEQQRPTDSAGPIVAPEPPASSNRSNETSLISARPPTKERAPEPIPQNFPLSSPAFTPTDPIAGDAVIIQANTERWTRVERQGWRKETIHTPSEPVRFLGVDPKVEYLVKPGIFERDGRGRLVEWVDIDGAS